ncbi:Crp/Fnr family transcriptional regulator [Fibrella sp. HMF5335]|uniref:Crp/Fnr family transcriptional regulator n=1 Tax=Fibrella rubiginis TaxID=2817060 RepID=A0A939K4V7_9BACT|nr:Crp/Fnr family transcriptional regulator [Fibrella rubiginis]MBO0937118.1 Crp/Fnr family transcriptional regulator [Fibrella rubiginis]
MTDRLLQQLNTIASLTETEEQAFVAITTTRRLRKKEWLMRQGDICRMVTFIYSGSLRLFHTVDGEEKTIQFFFENALYTDYLSFLTGQPTLENVQALEDCALVQFSRTDLEQLYQQHPVFERIGRISAERAFLSLSARNTLLTNQSPEVRYQQLIRARPDLFQRVPQYHIASFLGIKPESLSRIRKRMATR